MDDGEIDSNLEMFSNSNLDMPSSSMDSFFDEMLKDTPACTHTHTCNPPGPDYSHTHTCLHIHTKVLPGGSEGKVSANDSGESEEKNSKRRNIGGNREAVRKYRQKKKAMTASLEDEVARLKAENQELMKKLRDQAALEAEIVRLKCFLVDIRGRLDGEIGSFPYQRPTRNCGEMYANLGNPNPTNNYVPCNFQCGDQGYCLQPGMQQAESGEVGTMGNVNGVGGCDFQNMQCIGNQNAVCEMNNETHPAKHSAANKRKGQKYNSGLLNH